MAIEEGDEVRESLWVRQIRFERVQSIYPDLTTQDIGDHLDGKKKLSDVWFDQLQYQSGMAWKNCDRGVFCGER